MPFRSLLAAAVLALPLAAVADTPNIVPGQWQFTSTTSVTGEVPIPDQTETHQECIVQGDLDEFQFIEEEEGCELLDQRVTADGLDYEMVCRAEGGEANIVGTMTFLGERVEGRVDVATASPLGDLVIVTELQGERIDDC